MNLLLFKAAGEQCGVELDYVSSLIKAGDVFSSKFLSSIHGSTIRLFGKKMNCFDIVELLGKKRESIPVTSRLIVIDYQYHSFLLLTDSIKETVSVSAYDTLEQKDTIFSTVSLPHSDIHVLNLSLLKGGSLVPNTLVFAGAQEIHHTV